MRILVLCTILAAIGCNSDRKLAAPVPAAYRFLPANADVVVRVPEPRHEAAKVQASADDVWAASA